MILFVLRIFTGGNTLTPHFFVQQVPHFLVLGVSALVKAGSLQEAVKLFKRSPDAAGATSIVAAFGRRKDIQAARALLAEVHFHKICNDAFFRSLVVACNNCRAFDVTLSLLDAVNSAR